VTDKHYMTVGWLEDMLDAAKQISEYLAGVDIARFKRERLLQDAVIRNFEIMGEAAIRVLRQDAEFAAAERHLNLEVIYAMRNQLVHGYRTVDLDVVWSAAQENVPPLISRLQNLIETWRA